LRVSVKVFGLWANEFGERRDAAAEGGDIDWVIAECTEDTNAPLTGIKGKKLQNELMDWNERRKRNKGMDMSLSSRKWKEITQVR
jgi:hypothetical protein